MRGKNESKYKRLFSLYLIILTDKLLSKAKKVTMYYEIGDTWQSKIRNNSTIGKIYWNYTVEGSCAICVVVYYYLKVFSGKLKMFIVNSRANTKNKEYITNKPMK